VNACVIVNPKAGSAKDLAALLKQIKRIRPAHIWVTAKKGAAKSFARRAVREGYDYVIAAGGDGTLNEVINGVAKRADQIRVGLLPLGTGNDFARSVNLPASVDENLDLLKAGKTTAIDLVQVKSDRTRYFINVSAAGFSGAVNEKLTPKIKRTWGPLAYIRCAAAALPDLRAYRTTITFGPGDKLSLDLYNVVVANGQFVAGGTRIAPEADLSDGLLDIILVPKRPGLNLALLTAQFALGKHLNSDAIIFRRAPKISIKSRPGMWFNVDGELIGNEPAEFEVIPQAIQFIVGETPANDATRR
jgi:diacylglycerol kinase (ATP)